MNNKTITAPMVEPNKHPKVVQLATDLDSLQKAIIIGADYQGLIEPLPLEKGVSILCNEKRKLIGLPGNRHMGSDVIARVFYVIGSNHHHDLVSLTDQQLEIYKARFWKPEDLSAQDVEHAMFIYFSCYKP